MNKYSWLFFDLDNTLLDFGASSKLAFMELFKERGQDLNDSDYAVYQEINHKVWVDLEKGLITSEELKPKRWSLFLNKMGYSYDPLVINTAYFDKLKTNPIFIKGAEALINDLSTEYKLCLITNGLPEVQTPRLRLSGLDQMFDPIVISDAIGVAKPKEAFFDYCQKVTGNPMKEEVLVIGDTLTSDIRGGKEYGYDTCWYNYYQKENHTEYSPLYEITDLNELREILKRSVL